MPAASTHYIFAKEMLPVIQPMVDFEIDEGAFYYGTQGPDIFFFHRLFPWQGKSYSKHGSALHSKACPTDIFNCIRDYFLEHPEDNLTKSYFLGFFAHYILDSTTHAYIYFVNYEMHKKYHPRWWDFTVHNKVEFNIDTILIAEKLGISDATKFPIWETFSEDEEVKAAVGRGIAHIVNSVFHKDITPEKASVACKDTRAICKLTTDFKGKRKLFSILELPIRPFLGPAVTMFMRPSTPRTDWDYMNRNHAPWHNPFLENAPERTESFDELFTISGQKLCQFVEGFLKGIATGDDLTPLSGNLDFSHGIPVNETVAY